LRVTPRDIGSSLHMSGFLKWLETDDGKRGKKKAESDEEVNQPVRCLAEP
jgi:hypothetical protein